MAAVRGQTFTLLGRLETLGPGTTAAVVRRQQAKELDKRWRREEAAHTLARKQGWSAYHTGFARLEEKLKKTQSIKNPFFTKSDGKEDENVYSLPF